MIRNRLYHTTKIENIESILKNGLLINTGKFSFVKEDVYKSYFTKFGMQPIFLAYCPDYVLNTQIGKNSPGWAVLEINTEGLILEHEHDFKYLKRIYDCYDSWKKNCLPAKTFICKQNIEPIRIKVLRKYFHHMTF